MKDASQEIAQLRKQIETLTYKVQELTGERGSNPAVRISSGSTSSTNLQAGTIRWNTDGYWQRWNGAQWDDLTSRYKFTQVETSGALGVGSSDLDHVALRVGLALTGSTASYGFKLDPEVLSGVTGNAYGYHSNVEAGTGRWNFYAEGDAPNHFEGDVETAGNASIDGDATIGGDASVTGQASVTGGLTVGKDSVTSPTAGDGNVFSGTYTPTLTNVTNVADSTAYECQYVRIGNVVTVSGAVAIDATAAGTVELRVSLPIASNFTSSVQAGGAYAMQSNGSDKGVILADATNNALTFRHVAATLTNQVFNFTATYRVL